MVLPSLNRELVKCVFNEMTDGLPPIILQRPHRRLIPIRLSDFSPFKIDRDLVMAILEYVRGHLQILPDNPLDWVTPSVDTGVDIFDGNGWQRFQSQFFRAHVSPVVGLGLSGRPANKSAKNLKSSATEATSINVFIAGWIWRKNSRL